MSTPKAKQSHGGVPQEAAATVKLRSRKPDRFAGVSPKLAMLLRKQFPEKGRAERIARADMAWKEAVEIASTFKNIDDETWKWIALSKELEDV